MLNPLNRTDMKTWKNAIKKAALAVLIAVMVATTIICSAGALNYASDTAQHLYTVFGSLNLLLGFSAAYAVIQKAQKMDTIQYDNMKK